MSGVGYVIAAYVVAVALYGVYVTWLLRRERSLDRSREGTRDRG